MAALPLDDRDLDDATLWAVIDSATAAATARFRKPLTLTNSNFQSPPALISPPPPPPPPQPPLALIPPSPPSHQKLSKSPGCFNSPRPQKQQRLELRNTTSSHTPLINHLSINPAHQSPIVEHQSPIVEHRISEDKDSFRHCLSGPFPTVSLFKNYQNAAMSVLDKSDYIMISGNPFIKKSGWRKIAFYFNVSFEIRDKSIEFDGNRNVQRAEFLVRAYMQGGRFSDGWGSCERREKRFMKPNSDIPSTAETRAKNKACQDLIGIGLFQQDASHSRFPCQ